MYEVKVCATGKIEDSLVLLAGETSRLAVYVVEVVCYLFLLEGLLRCGDQSREGELLSTVDALEVAMIVDDTSHLALLIIIGKGEEGLQGYVDVSVLHFPPIGR